MRYSDILEGDSGAMHTIYTCLPGAAHCVKCPLLETSKIVDCATLCVWERSLLKWSHRSRWGKQVRLSAFTKRDDEASKTGGQPFSHRAFGEVVAQKLQVCPPRCPALSGQ